MSKPIIKIVNSMTGEEIEREMTSEEFSKYEADNLASAETLAAREAEAAALLAAKQSAQDKLAALGLTPEEILALIG